MKILFLKLCFAVFLIGGISQSVLAQETLEKANNHFNKGKKLFDSLRYAEAKEEFDRALEAYGIVAEGLAKDNEIEHIEGQMKKCRDNIAECSRRIEEANKKTDKSALPVPVDGAIPKPVEDKVREQPEKKIISTTANQNISLKVNETALIFEANGGTKYITVTTDASDWELVYHTNIPGFTITKEGKKQIRVACTAAMSPTSIQDSFKVRAGEKEVKITVYCEGKKVITQSYEESIKGNPFALRTSRWNTYHWGISAGYVSKKLKYKDLDGKTDSYGLLTDKSLPGIQAGIHYEGFFMPEICGLGMAAGAYYEYYWQKGDTQSGEGFDDYYASYKEHNVYVPLNLLFRFDFSKKVNIALYGGIGANYGVGNKVEYKDASDDETFEEKKGLYDYEEYGIKHFFMNIEYGGSIRYGRLSVNARFFSPLTDWSEDKFYSEKPVKDMNLSVSFMF